MAKYIVESSAEADLHAIWRFIAQDNPSAAFDVIDAAYKTFAILAEHPRIGIKREFPAFRRQDIRSWPVSGFDQYVIFYYPCPDGASIVAVYHTARHVEALFERG